MSSSTEKTALFSGVKDGETFVVGGMEFIKFPGEDGRTPAVMKAPAFRCEFGSNNDLRKSKVLRRMEEEILPKIIEALGEENVCIFKTDLTTLDGLKPYGEMYSRISLPTFDFYRANVDIFDKHKPHDWWWLATPESAQPHSEAWWTLCVSPSGNVDYCDIYFNVGGVRPFCIFKSSIFGSCEE